MPHYALKALHTIFLIGTVINRTKLRAVLLRAILMRKLSII